MTMSDERPVDRYDDNDLTAYVLRLAGPREEPSPERTLRVRQAVLAESRIVAKRRRALRIATGVGAGLALAAAAVLAVRVWSPDAPSLAVPGQAVATVEQVDGVARRLPAGSETALQSLAVDASIHAGDGIATTPGGRLALRLEGGTSVRFDISTRARLLSSDTIELTEGALYVDNPEGSRRVGVRTPLGTVREIGTQFEVRITSSSLRVRVRSGVVNLLWADREASARAGTELTVAAGRLDTRAIPGYDPAWNWTAALAPTIPIDGRPLRAVLEDLCREHGRTLGYTDAALAREASAAMLRGSIEGLSFEDSLTAVLAPSDLSYRLLRNGEVLVTRAAGGRVP
jgi:ferric-dicitrate binding protein FerR (iron transport regulator)